jgi:hypothetical protein
VALRSGTITAEGHHDFPARSTRGTNLALPRGVRVLLAFAAGFVVSATVWVILDLQSGSPAPPPRELGDPPTAMVSPLATECEVAQPASAPRARADTVDDDAVLASGAPHPSWPRPYDPVDEPSRTRTEDSPESAPATPADTTPTLGVATGFGVEVPLDGASDSSEVAGVRVLVDLDRRFGVELGLSRAFRGRLTSTSVEAAVKWHVARDRALRPYATAGVGWRRYHRDGSGDVVTVPIGIGVAYQRGRWIADGRLTLRPVVADHRHAVAASTFLGITF